jgi:hypothetical protein
MTSPHSLAARFRAALLLSALLATSSATLAREAPVSDHARRARIAYDLRDWVVATAEFRAAYEADPRSEHLFGLAQALRQNRDHAAAIFTFKAYKRSEGVTAQQATAAELLISQCEAEQTKAEAEAAREAARAAANVDARSPEAATSAPLASQPLNRAVPAPVATEPDSTSFYADAFGDVLFITGLAATGVGTGLLLHGNATMRDSDEAPTEASAADQSADARQAQTAGAVLFPVGGALIVGALWRWLSVGSDRPEAEGLSLGPGSISVHGQF